MRPLPQSNAALAFVLGIGVAGTAAWWRGEQILVVSDKNDPAPILGAPLLVSIRDFKLVGAEGPVTTISAPGSGAAEAYQFALSSLGFALEEFSSSTVLMTSTSPNEGKSATALNLSSSAAQVGRKGLLVDADERAWGLTFLSGLLASFGVADLNSPVDVDRAIHQWDIADGSRLKFVPAGSGVVRHTATFFRSEGFRAALNVLLDSREIVIVDAPLVMAAAETTDIGAAVDGIVRTFTEGTGLRDLEEARHRIMMSGTPIIGYLFKRAVPKSGANGYGYGYGSAR